MTQMLKTIVNFSISKLSPICLCICFFMGKSLDVFYLGDHTFASTRASEMYSSV